MQKVTSTRYNQVSAGLDNAVRQSERRKFQDTIIVDTDCHQSEPFAFFTKYVPNPEYREVLLQPDPEAAMRQKLGYGTRIKRPEVSYPGPMSPSELVETFGKRMLDIGIKKSIVLPSSMLDLSLDPRNPDFEVQVSEAYIRYMLEHCLSSENIFTMIYASTTAPDKSAELIEEFGSEKGIVGIMIPGVTPTPPGSDELNPIYEEAQRKGLPIAVHGHHYRGGGFLDKFDKMLYTHSLGFPLSVIRQLTSIVLDGVPERFQNLKFAFMEGGVTWIPWIMQRLDDEYVKRRHEAPLLKKLPSEYIKDFYFTSQPLERAHPKELQPFFEMIDAENHLMFSSDYPHWDFDVPSVIYDLPFLSKGAKTKILGENAMNFFTKIK